MITTIILYDGISYFYFRSRIGRLTLLLSDSLVWEFGVLAPEFFFTLCQRHIRFTISALYKFMHVCAFSLSHLQLW